MGKRFLVMGCGSIGRRHVRNLLMLNAGDVVVYDPNEEHAKKAEGTIRVKTLDEAWAKKPDIVVVAAPTSAHLECAIQAAERKCHLFIEKPLASESAGVNGLLNAVRQFSLVTLVGCNMRFHPGLRQVKVLLNKQTIGRILGARLEFGSYLPEWHPNEDYRQGYSARRSLGGGVLLDGIHELDYARWMFGDVREVGCFSGRLSSLAIDTEDMAAVLLRFSSGMIAEVHMDYVQRSYSRSLQIIGEEGTIRWEWGNDVRLYTARSKRWKTFSLPMPWDLNEMYVDEMKHFLRCLKGDEKSEQDVFAAAQALKIALAAKKSSETGRFIPVEVP